MLHLAVEYCTLTVIDIITTIVSAVIQSAVTGTTDTTSQLHSLMSYSIMD